MINISNKDLSQYEMIDNGTFGLIYKVDDNTAYKIYRLSVRDKLGFRYDNPCLQLPKSYFIKKMKKNNKLQYTDGIKDLIYINGKFGGISIPYYNGKNLKYYSKYPLKLKIDLSKQIVRNVKELSNNYLYRTDDKIENIMLVNDEIKIVDLDDIRTHCFNYPNPLFNELSTRALGLSVQLFFNMHHHSNLPTRVASKLKREQYFVALNYNKINHYIDRMAQEKNFIFIDNNTDIEKLKEIMTHNDFEIIYLLDNKLEKNEYLKIIEELKKEKIDLFDFVFDDKKEEYSCLYNINESYQLSGKELKKVPQKN